MKEQLYKSKVKEAPLCPGCYIWRDTTGTILYIGKAVNLRSRTSSYYTNYERLDPKIKLMVDQIDDVEYLTVDNEVEALILETNLIKKYRPKYNKLMKDDKNYSWLMIDWYRPYPQIKIVREKNDKKAEYYGPYPQRFPINQVLKRLRKIFPYCEHLKGKDAKFCVSTSSVSPKPCFDYHLGLCSGICIGKVTKAQHRANINGIRKFFKGQKMELIEEMKSKMNVYAKNMKFESATILRDNIKDLEYVTQRIRIENDMDDTKLQEMKKNIRERALEDLCNRLKLDNKTEVIKKDFRIECYDISNIQGTNAVGSMVVFIDGRPDTDLYRKFKIKTKETPDDFAMMKEVLRRRMKYINVETQNLASPRDTASPRDISFSQVPDLIIVDGGKGQLSSAHQILKEFKLENSIPLIGLAKREEEIFRIEEGDFTKVNAQYIAHNPLIINFKKTILPRRSEALYLVQRIRDEAHRFAIGFHRKIRTDKSTKSILDDIPGVGEVTKKRLLQAYGSIENIRKTKKEELATIVRNRRTLSAINKILTNDTNQ